MRGDPAGLDDALRLAALQVRRPGWSSYDGLDALLAVCLGTVPGVSAAAISSAGHDRVGSTHATDPAVRDMDAWHNRLGCGPLLDGARLAPPALDVLLVRDLTLEVGDGAVRVSVTPPFRALHSTTLRSGDGRRTALDLYAVAPDGVGPDTTVLADMFARRAVSLLDADERPVIRVDHSSRR